jgi:hypothetical protein
MITNLRYECPLNFLGNYEVQSRYELECRRIRSSLPAGSYEVAPRLRAVSPRGRTFIAGTRVSAGDFDGGEHAAHEVLSELVAQGYVLESSQTSDAEREAIAQHVASVRTLNAAGVNASAAGKLDALLASGRFARVENTDGPEAA